MRTALDHIIAQPSWLWHGRCGKFRPWGFVTPANVGRSRFLGRAAVTHVQGSAQRWQRLVLRGGLRTPGSKPGCPSKTVLGAKMKLRMLCALAPIITNSSFAAEAVDPSPFIPACSTGSSGPLASTSTIVGNYILEKAMVDSKPSPDLSPSSAMILAGVERLCELAGSAPAYVVAEIWQAMAVETSARPSPLGCTDNGEV